MMLAQKLGRDITPSMEHGGLAEVKEQLCLWRDRRNGLELPVLLLILQEFGPSRLAVPTLCTNTAHPYLFLCVCFLWYFVPSCLWFGSSMGKEDERPIFHCEFVAYETLLSPISFKQR